MGLTREDHTDIAHAAPVQRYVLDGARFLSLRAKWLGDRLYVDQYYGDDGAAARGDEVLSIDGRPTAEVLRELGAPFASDAYVTAVKASDLDGFGLAQNYYTRYGEPAPGLGFAVRLANSAGREREEAPQALTFPET